jgi:hypothetical protein
VRGPALLLDTEPVLVALLFPITPASLIESVDVFRLFAKWPPLLHLLHRTADMCLTRRAYLSAVMSRENDLIKTVRQLTYSDKYMGKKVLPLMAKDAFLDVMAGGYSLMPEKPEKPVYARTHAHTRTHTYTYTYTHIRTQTSAYPPYPPCSSLKPFSHENIDAQTCVTN